jgi:hypothetical protein
MFEPRYFARVLLAGGAVLLVFGLILWRMLPIATHFPPYMVTAALALGYGGYEWRRGRTRQDRE